LRITTRQLFNPSIKVCSKVVYIRNNSGDEDQAQDVVQEVLILLFNQAKPKLQLTCPFDAYFFTLQRKWLNELKNQ
jgi:DNA-directed RNA polymerase specialized sigma24 family protein